RTYARSPQQQTSRVEELKTSAELMHITEASPGARMVLVTFAAGGELNAQGVPFDLFRGWLEIGLPGSSVSFLSNPCGARIAGLIVGATDHYRPSRPIT